MLKTFDRFVFHSRSEKVIINKVTILESDFLFSFPFKKKKEEKNSFCKITKT